MSTSTAPSNTQQLFVMTYCGINEKIAQCGGIDVQTSLLAANQNVRHSALCFKEETALLMAQTQSIKEDSKWKKLLDSLNGRDIKEIGVKDDGTAFWVGTKQGTKQLTPLNHLPLAMRPPPLEDLINCKISKAQVQWNGQNARKGVFVVVNVWTEVKPPNLMNGNPQTDVDGVYPTLQEANQKVKDIASAYAAKLGGLMNMFGWGETAALLCSSKCEERPDGTLSWGGLREFKMDGSDPATGAAHVSAYKRVIDKVHDDNDEDLVKLRAAHPPQIPSNYLLDPPAPELRECAPYSQQLFLVAGTSIIVGEGSHAVTEMHGVFNTLERANRKIEEDRERVKNIDKIIEDNYRLAFKKMPWFLEDGYESLSVGGTRADGTKMWVEPIRSRTKAKDEGCMIGSVQTLVQVGENKGEASPAPVPSFKFGQEVFIVAETALVEDKRGVRPDLKVYGIFKTLKDANEKVKKVATEYGKWHDEVVAATAGSSWHEGGKTSWDGVDDKGGFFWVGARTRTELCRVDVHKCVVDWLQEDHDEEDEKHVGGCWDKKCARCWCQCKVSGCAKDHWIFDGDFGKRSEQDTEMKDGDESARVAGGEDSGKEGQLTFELSADELLKQVAQQFGG